jgi:putative membrane protein
MLTTARSSSIHRFRQNRLLQTLIAIYAGVWVWAAIAPFDRSAWMLENLLVVATIGCCVWVYRTRPLSDVSSILLTVFMIFHAIGSHYTYSLVPFGDWLKEAAGLERNHYDRIIHFSFGLLLVYPIRELFLRTDVGKSRWLGVIAFMVIATLSGGYELMEWGAAVVVDPKAGQAFLGTQGDPFDAQADHLLACIGAAVTLAITRLAERVTPVRAAGASITPPNRRTV